MHPCHFARPRLIAGITAAFLAARVGAEPPEPIPGPEDATRTVSILQARDAGAIAVVTRGKGEDRVKVTIRNTSPRRLNVVMPPGLVAAAATGQLQSMGLGDPENAPGGFGAFDTGGNPYSEAPRGRRIAVPAGHAVDLIVPGICLNYGLRTPTVHDVFRLMDVDEYTRDPVARRALRGLATLGTSHGVAQAVAWHAFNGLALEELAGQGVRPFNNREVALAEGLIAHLEADGGPIDGAALARGRVTIEVRGEGGLAAVARRLGREVDGRRILGLIVAASPPPEPPVAPALHLVVALAPGKGDGPAPARVGVRYAPAGGPWSLLGVAPIPAGGRWADLDGSALAEAVDRAVAAAFVSARPLRRSTGLTTLRIDNRLPFTLAHVVVRSGEAPVPLPALGIGPGRRGTALVQAAGATIERVELNGL